jgi:hypothetical protein
MQDGMRVGDLALAQGIRDTRTTLSGWRDDRWRVLGRWAGLSFIVAVSLLLAVYVVALLSVPDTTPLYFPGVGEPADLEDLGFILFGNSLVLALHAFACVAGFIAGSSLPRSAEGYSGAWRWIHDKAGPLAIAFVIAATAFSLITQAFILGGHTSTFAAQFGLSPAIFLLAVVPHALPELTALFLPLAAWTLASRAGDWHQLLAATFVTVAVAVPILIATALWEIYVTPQLLIVLSSM